MEHPTGPWYLYIPRLRRGHPARHLHSSTPMDVASSEGGMKCLAKRICLC
jgi:hypothetical protein